MHDAVETADLAAARAPEPAAPPHGRRVLIIVENLPVPFDRRVWNIATTLRAAGHQVSVICPKGMEYQAGYEEIQGIHVYRHPLPVEANGALGYLVEYSTALAWEFLLSLRVLFTRGFDAVHICNPPDILFLVGGFFKLFGKRLVFDHHDLCPELYLAKFNRQNLYWRLLVACERLTFRAADISIATNNSYRQVALERGGMPEDRVFVVRSGPNLDRMRILPPSPEYRNGRRHLVGYVGVMGAQEGLRRLLSTVRHIVFDLDRHDIQFAFVGSGTELPALRVAAVELGVQDYVTFTGRVPDQQMLEVLNTADVCINADECNELNDKSTMNKIMEYMALAKPIVQYDMTEGRFSAGESSLYARPGDHRDFAAKILELLDDPERRRKMGAFGRERVERVLAWTHETPKLLDAYASLWAEPTAARVPVK